MAAKTQDNRAGISPPALELSLRDYIEILERWKYVIIGITLAFFIGAVLYTYSALLFMRESRSFK